MGKGLKGGKKGGWGWLRVWKRGKGQGWEMGRVKGEEKGEELWWEKV